MTEEKNFTHYCLLTSTPSAEDFLKETFQCSANRLKKYFDKSFLNKSLNARATLKLPLDFINDGEINPSYEGPVLEILYEDETFLVINKPSNLFVHPLSYSEKNNCLSYLRSKRPDLLKVNESMYDRGLLYRLDFETSGVLVYVKDDTALRFLREHFKTTAKKKIYHCLVEGDCHLSGKFTHYFSSREEKGKRVVVKNSGEQDEMGVIELRALEYKSESGVTLMEVQLFQGLRHQIRAQLAHLGFPIRGDVFYGGRPASRLYLNASQYDIDFQGRSYHFTCDPHNFSGL